MSTVLKTAVDTLFIPAEFVIPAPFTVGGDGRHGYVQFSREWTSISVSKDALDVRRSEFDPLDPPNYDGEILKRAGIPPLSEPDAMRHLQSLAIAVTALRCDWP